MAGKIVISKRANAARARRGTSVAYPKGMKYAKLYDLATTPGNELLIFENGKTGGLITTPNHKQGVWVSSSIIALWQAEGLI